MADAASFAAIRPLLRDFPVDALEFVLTGLEGLEQDRIELAGCAIDVTHGLGVRQGRLVGTLATQRLVDVGQSGQAGRVRDVLAAKAIGIALAVEALVVMSDDGSSHAQES